MPCTSLPVEMIMSQWGGPIAASSDTVDMNLACFYAAEKKSWCPAEVLIALCAKIWFS